MEEHPIDIQVMDRITDGIVVLDAEWNYRYVNRAAARMLNRTNPEELIGKNYWEEYPEARGTPFAEAYARAMADQKAILLEDHYEPWDRWFENRIYPLDGGISILFTEITDRKRAERMLQTDAQILELAGGGAGLPEVLEAIVLGFEALSPGAIGSILLLDPDGVHVRHGAAPNLPEAYNSAIDGEPIGPQAGSCGTAAFLKAPVIVTDIETDPLWDTYRPAALAHGLRACWSTPILDPHGEVLGTFAIYYRQTRSPGERDYELIERASDLASLVITRHLREKALAESEARYYDLFEHAPDMLFSVAAHNAAILDCNQTTLDGLGYTRDEVIGRPIFTFFHPDSLPAARRIFEEFMESGEVLDVELQAVRKDGSVLDVSLSITALRNESGEIVQSRSAWRDITRRKQVEADIRRSTRQVFLLNEITRIALEARDRDAMFQHLADKVGELFEADGCYITLWDPTQGGTIPHTATGELRESYRSMRPEEGDLTMTESVLKAERVLAIEDVFNTPYISRRLAERFKTRSALALPLISAGEKLGAMLIQYNTPRSFSDEDVDFGEQAASQLALAIAKVILIDEVSRRNIDLRTLTQRLAETEENERRSLARELHDSIGQYLTALNINLNILKSQLPAETAAVHDFRIQDSLRLVRETIATTRDVINTLRPPLLDEFGLSAALRKHAEEFSARTGIKVRWSQEETDVELAAPIENTLFRVGQEALTNIAKHSEATRVDIRFDLHPARVRLLIADNGKGMRTGTRNQGQPAGWGLITMQERLEAMGGELQVDSDSGTGTRVRAEVPL